MLLDFILGVDLFERQTKLPLRSFHTAQGEAGVALLRYDIAIGIERDAVALVRHVVTPVVREVPAVM
jgi:hypothetical protein